MSSLATGKPTPAHDAAVLQQGKVILHMCWPISETQVQVLCNQNKKDEPFCIQKDDSGWPIDLLLSYSNVPFLRNQPMQECSDEG